MVSQPGATAWRVAAAALILPGLVLGHLMAYRLAYPTAHERMEHLHHTGHGEFPLLVLVACAVLPLALGIAVVAALRSTRRVSLRQATLTMMVLQPAAFLLLELLERGGSVAATVGDPAVLVGAALQPPIAAAIVYLLAAVGFAVRWSGVRSSRRRPWQPDAPLLILWAPEVTRTHRFDARCSVAQRAPPRSLPA